MAEEKMEETVNGNTATGPAKPRTDIVVTYAVDGETVEKRCQRHAASVLKELENLECDVTVALEITPPGEASRAVLYSGAAADVRTALERKLMDMDAVYTKVVALLTGIAEVSDMKCACVSLVFDDGESVLDCGAIVVSDCSPVEGRHVSALATVAGFMADRVGELGRVVYGNPAETPE
jgi:hypothetical protein